MESPKALVRRLQGAKSSSVVRWHKSRNRPTLAPNDIVLWEDEVTGKVRIITRLRSKVYTFDPAQVEENGAITVFDPGGQVASGEEPFLVFTHGPIGGTAFCGLGGQTAGTNQGWVPHKSGQITSISWNIPAPIVSAQGNIRIQATATGVYSTLQTINIPPSPGNFRGTAAISGPTFVAGVDALSMKILFDGFNGTIPTSWYGLGLRLD